MQFLTLLSGGFIATTFEGKFHSRFACIIVANTVCILGAGLLVGLSDANKWGRLVALWLCYFQGLGFSMSLTMVSSNIAGYTKKQITGAVLFTGYCVGNIIGPQTFKASEAPGYHSAYIAYLTGSGSGLWLDTDMLHRMLVGYVVKLTAIFALYVHMHLDNKRRDREALGSEESEDGVENGMLVYSRLLCWVLVFPTDQALPGSNRD